MSNFKILFIGQTQAGKSCLIKSFFQYNNLTVPDNLKIGNGDHSTTKETTIYSLDLNTKIYDQNKISLDLIDTPGLDDSNDNNEHIMIDILNSLDIIKQIGTICFVINSNSAYTGTFLQIFKYYTDILSLFKNRLVIVHTNFGYEKKISNEKRINQRIDNFYNSTGFKGKHFFIDCVNNSSNIYSDQIKKLFDEDRYGVLTDLILYFKFQKNMVFNNILYKKSNEIKSIDNILKGYYEGKSIGCINACEYIEINQNINEILINLWNYTSESIKIDEKIKRLTKYLDTLKNLPDEKIIVDLSSVPFIECDNKYVFSINITTNKTILNISKNFLQHYQLNNEIIEYNKYSTTIINNNKKINGYIVLCIQNDDTDYNYYQTQLKQYQDKLNIMTTLKDNCLNELKKFDENNEKKFNEFVITNLKENRQIIEFLNDDYYDIQEFIKIMPIYKEFKKLGNNITNEFFTKLEKIILNN